jgi:hypothetical protein
MLTRFIEYYMGQRYKVINVSLPVPHDFLVNILTEYLPVISAWFYMMGWYSLRGTASHRWFYAKKNNPVDLPVIEYICVC